MLKANYAARGNRSKPPLKHLAEAFAGMRAADITTERVWRYEADRLAAGDARGTVNLQLAVLRRMFNLALKARRVAMKPFIETPDPHNARSGLVTAEDLVAILAKLPDWG